MDDFDKLLKKLIKIKALHRGATTEGERIAALEAHNRLVARLKEAERERVGEWRFSIPDPWKRRLFRALCRHHGYEPFRYHRQRYSSVMLKASNVFVNEVLWPQYEEFSATLSEYLDDITTRVIREVLDQEDEDITIMHGKLLE